jgi:beta-glucosidase
MTLAKVAFTLVNLVAVGSTAKNVADGFVAAPYYPAPYGGWDESWAASYARAKKMVDSMTLAEKTNITAGTGLFMGKKDNLRRNILATNKKQGTTLCLSLDYLY